MKQYKITIKVVFDEATVPKHMKRDLERNLDSAIQLGLFADANEEAVVEEYSAEVEEIVNPYSTQWLWRKRCQRST